MKDYVLTLLFMKYVSDKYAGKPDAIMEVPKGGSFADMVALKGDKEIGDKINKIIGRRVGGAVLRPAKSLQHQDGPHEAAGKDATRADSRLQPVRGRGHARPGTFAVDGRTYPILEFEAKSHAERSVPVSDDVA